MANPSLQNRNFNMKRSHEVVRPVRHGLGKQQRPPFSPCGSLESTVWGKGCREAASVVASSLPSCLPRHRPSSSVHREAQLPDWSMQTPFQTGYFNFGLLHLEPFSSHGWSRTVKGASERERNGLLLSQTITGSGDRCLFSLSTEDP